MECGLTTRSSETKYTIRHIQQRRLLTNRTDMLWNLERSNYAETSKTGSKATSQIFSYHNIFIIIFEPHTVNRSYWSGRPEEYGKMSREREEKCLLVKRYNDLDKKLVKTRWSRELKARAEWAATSFNIRETYNDLQKSYQIKKLPQSALYDLLKAIGKMDFNELLDKPSIILLSVQLSIQSQIVVYRLACLQQVLTTSQT